MKYLMNKISPILLKLFIVFFAVLALSACADKDDTGALVVGEIRPAYGDDANGTVTEQTEIDGSKRSTSISEERCMSCQILTMMYDAVGYNVSRLHEDFSSAAMSITMVGFAIWLALRLLKFVSSVSETNAGEVWNEILRKAFICLICGLLASTPQMLQYTLNMIVFPLYLAFLDLGTQILQHSLAADPKNPANNPAAVLAVFGETIKVEGVKITCDISSYGRSPLSETVGDAKVGFPTSIRDTMRCMINVISAYLEIGGDIAWTAMKQPSAYGIGLVMGFIIYMFFYIVRIGFVFYLVDCIFQMGIIILLLPLFIVSYAFGPTKKWTGIGLSKVLASAGFMMCFSIIIASVVRAMIELITNNPEIYNPSDTQAAISDISLGFICLLLIGCLVYGSMGVCQQLTSGLIGGKVDANFQKNLKAVVQAGIRIGWNILSGIITWGVSIAPNSSIALVRKVGRTFDKAKAFREKTERWAGRTPRV